MTAKFSPLPLFDEPQPWQNRQFALSMVAARDGTFRPDFTDWLTANYAIWLAFEREADRIWNSGRRHYSARTIVEWMRHETALRESPNEYGFKINDHATPDLARLYLAMHPDRDGFFERRLAPLSLRTV